MTKVTIFEDNAQAVNNRYGHLLQDKDVTVLLVGQYSVLDRLKLEKQKPVAAIRSYRTLKSVFEDEQDLDADVFFVDGLEGRFVEVFERLEGKNIYLLTGSPNNQKFAESKGIQFIEESQVNEVMRRHTNG